MKIGNNVRSFSTLANVLFEIFVGSESNGLSGFDSGELYDGGLGGRGGFTLEDSGLTSGGDGARLLTCFFVFPSPFITGFVEKPSPFCCFKFSVTGGSGALRFVLYTKVGDTFLPSVLS